MRARTAILLGFAAFALCAAPAAAGSRPPIVRPDDERGMPSTELGRQLFAGNCAACHGSRGQGISTPGRRRRGSTIEDGMGPSLLGVGALATDFYLRTGYMPLGDPFDQPVRRRPAFDDREIRALESYVDSLGEPGPPVPRPDPSAGSLSEGRSLFTQHCAGCHQVVAEGGVVTGARVPPLADATTTQIAQAVRIGPYVMPRFSARDISDEQLDSLVRYVRYAQHPDDPGGASIDHLGPFPEGIVTGGMAAIVLVGICVLLGERARGRP